MDTLIKADIFFFISSVAVVIIALLIAYVVYRVSQALREIERLAELLGENVESASEDVRDMVLDMRDSFLYKILFPKRRRRNNK